MGIKISALIGINDCILAIYHCQNRTYSFSVVNAVGRTYTCETYFPSLSSAKFMGISVTERLAIDCDRSW
jgi:hypothetical protein